MAQAYLDFLKTLAANNHKDWMDANKDLYQSVRKEFLQEVTDLLEQLCAIDEDLVTLEPKHCIFRQNRDVRFSSNKEPYKRNLAAYFAPGGKKSPFPGYYLHIQPNESFVGGGIWMPEAPILKAIRQEIDYSGAELAELLQSPSIKNFYGAIKAEQLKNAPKGFDADHPLLDLLKFKSFVLTRPITDLEVASGKFKSIALDAFKRLMPFNRYLKRAILEAE
jgi:uncharacterized protein (TIGR02453 family)